MVTFAAFLHDVADHKYDTPDSVVEEYLAKVWPDIENTIKKNEQNIGDWTVEKMMGVIRIVSFSKEKKWRCVHLGIIENIKDPKWKTAKIKTKNLTVEQRESFHNYGSHLGPEGKLVRDIVSDADKIEAIGRRGVERCWQYSEELWDKKLQADGIEDNEEAKTKWIKARVVEHYHEKLKLLGTEYIKTKSGKELASQLNKEMEDEVKQFATDEGIAWIE